MTAGRVRADIREIEVKRDKHTIFGDAGCQKIGIWCSRQSFGVGSLDVVPKFAQRGLDPSGEVLVEFEAEGHLTALRRQSDESLSG